MTRSSWKGPFVDGYILKKADAARAAGRHSAIKTWSRRSTILPQFVGLTFQVHNEAITIPENVDCIRALTGLERNPDRSIQMTDVALGVTKVFLPSTTGHISNLVGRDVHHPPKERVGSGHPKLRDVRPEGTEEPED